MPRTSRIALSLAATLALTGVLVGCGRLPVTAPANTTSSAPKAPAPEPPSRLTVGSTSLGTVLDPVLNVVWKTICSAYVVKGTTATMNASHYTLQFATGSLPQSSTIIMQEYDSRVLDMQFGPHGTQFGTPVVLTINFSGTACDPSVVTGNTPEPVLWYLNETTNTWEEIPGGVTDWKNRTFTVPLQHFSRYVLGGKAGWKQGPPRADE